MSAQIAPNEDAWTSWREELSGLPRALPRGKVAQGYYELRTKIGRQVLAVFWDEDVEDFVGRLGADGEDQLADEEFCERVFSRSKAISHEVYEGVINGHGWPEERALRESAGDEDTGNPHEDRPNTPPEKHADIADRGAELDRKIRKWVQGIGGEIKSQADADTAGKFKADLKALEDEAAEGKRTEKAPVLAEADRLEKLWAPVVADRKRSRERITDLIGGFLKAETARKAAERKAALEAGRPAPEAKVTAGGAGGGRKVSLMTVTSVAFDDFEKAWAQVAATKAFKENRIVRPVFDQVVHQLLRSGGEVEGARLVEEQRAR
ncbi:hypothetical protein [Enterovirga rhinocerotis]|uniref:Uncharacterized protein n=1 Tax=Enterovirga rhinocerotis TaxID=1339210 RepID=A0A4V3DXW5_9HYPH|nr:hypothetical protein [Enterovirga rhinocerotis]TDR90339.1 hypothetical protein EV668_3190 [Enterovirga rhinocerotis]